MVYELKIAWRTIRREGLGSLSKKISLYFQQLVNGIRFLMLPKPHNASIDTVVDFSFKAAGGLIYPGQVRSEILQLAEVIKAKKPKVIVEIGTANGGTLWVWCALADPNALIASIDLPGGIHGGGYPYWKSFIYKNFAQRRQSLRLIRANSHDVKTFEQLKAILPKEGIDFLFIDGDHTYEGVKTDFELYSPLVRRGGMIALHDICLHPPEMDCHVDKFWNEVRQRYPSREYVEDPRQGGFGIGIVEV